MSDTRETLIRYRLEQADESLESAQILLESKKLRPSVSRKELSSWLQEAFDLRQRADYRELFTVSVERAEKVLGQARTFVAEVKIAITRK